MIDQTIAVDGRKDAVDKSVPMQFILAGLSHHAGSRIFAFTGVAADKTRTPFTVGVDLALIRRYSIRIQELPLLCRELLDRRTDGEARALAFTEEEMRLYADRCVAARLAAAEKRKSPRKRPVQNGGTGWLAQQPAWAAHR